MNTGIEIQPTWINLVRWNGILLIAIPHPGDLSGTGIIKMLFDWPVSISTVIVITKIK